MIKVVVCSRFSGLIHKSNRIAFSKITGFTKLHLSAPFNVLHTCVTYVESNSITIESNISATKVRL